MPELLIIGICVVYSLRQRYSRREDFLLVTQCSKIHACAFSRGCLRELTYTHYRYAAKLLRTNQADRIICFAAWCSFVCTDNCSSCSLFSIVWGRKSVVGGGAATHDLIQSAVLFFSWKGQQGDYRQETQLLTWNPLMLLGREDAMRKW